MHGSMRESIYLPASMYLCSILLIYEKDHDDLINNDHGCNGRDQGGWMVLFLSARGTLTTVIEHSIHS